MMNPGFFSSENCVFFRGAIGAVPAWSADSLEGGFLAATPVRSDKALRACMGNLCRNENGSVAILMALTSTKSGLWLLVIGWPQVCFVTV